MSKEEIRLIRRAPDRPSWERGTDNFGRGRKGYQTEGLAINGVGRVTRDQINAAVFPVIGHPCVASSYQSTCKKIQIAA